MIHLSALIGRNAMDVTTATTVGIVTGIGLTGDRITSVRVHGETIAATSVRGFDGDVLTYEPTVAAEGSVQPTPIDPRGSKVLDRHGDCLGTIKDLTITSEGVVEAVLLDDGHALHGSRLQVIGSYAAIVRVDDSTTA